jgi:hypothetical protein
MRLSPLQAGDLGDCAGVASTKLSVLLRVAGGPLAPRAQSHRAPAPSRTVWRRRKHVHAASREVQQIDEGCRAPEAPFHRFCACSAATANACLLADAHKPWLFPACWIKGVSS